MPTYLTPGIYVEEVSGGARPIEAVGTSTAGFVGVTPDVEAHVDEAKAVNNWSEFVRVYAPEGSDSTPLSHAVYGFFENGGGRCYVVNVGRSGSIAGGGRKRSGLDLLAEVDEVAIVAAPGYTDVASYDVLLTHCEGLGDRVAILDAPESVRDIESLTIGATGAPKEGDETVAVDSAHRPGQRARQSDEGYGAYYFPWISVRDPLRPGAAVNVAPSGHIAGIYARTDARRGVHKAPANEVVRGALSLTYALTRSEQGVLNQAGVNCLRLFPREGIRVCGGRGPSRQAAVSGAT